MSKKEWAVVGRTFGMLLCGSLNDARETINDLGDKVLEYDGEVSIYHKVDGEWKEHERY